MTARIVRYSKPLWFMTIGLLGFPCSAFADYRDAAFSQGTAFGATSTPGDAAYHYTDTYSSALVTFTSSPVASVGYQATPFDAAGNAGISAAGVMTNTFEVAAQPFSSVPVDFSGITRPTKAATPHWPTRLPD